MRIMTFNLRFENSRDGENSWENRRHVAAQLIHRYRPSLLGTQEGTPRQLDYLRCELSGYRMMVGDRPAEDETCQYPTLFYGEDRFRVQETGELWLSSTPTVHRSKDWDSAFPRMMSYGVLEDRKAGREFTVIVTHLDHVGQWARIEQARLIREWVNRRPSPCILMGDFNDHPGSEVHQLLTDEQAPWKDTWDMLGKAEGVQSMTHHDFRGSPEKFRMDWILVSSEFLPVNASIVRDQDNGRYPSDHFPLMVDVEWR